MEETIQRARQFAPNDSRLVESSGEMQQRETSYRVALALLQVQAREELRAAFEKYEGVLELALDATTKGSDAEENILASLTQVESARRVVWMD
jgi:hypothetical protein